ncbi:MAG: hybrid sensor histidine kinase/response regulator [Panacagrimonas sp.]
MLRRFDGLKSTVLQGLDAIERNSRLQGQLIGDLLDYAGIRFGKLRVVRELVNPHAPLRAALAGGQATADERGITLSLQLTGDEVTLFADPARIQQIAWNLVSNALKFTDRGGTVQVRTAVEPEHFVLEVLDSGKGISPEFLPNLFDRFSQEDASTTRRHGGLGLGLAIVRSLVQIQQGTITAHSDGIGRGARFTVRLPRSSESSSPLPASDIGDSSLLKNADLLVVEDDADTRAFLKRILEQAGANVIGVANADVAEQALESTTPDLLICDIGMAERDGYDLIRSVRANGLSVDRPSSHRAQRICA